MAFCQGIRGRVGRARRDKLTGFAKEIEGEGGKALVVAADVSNAAEIEGVFARIRGELGDVDVLLYNAAMRLFGRLLETQYL